LILKVDKAFEKDLKDIQDLKLRRKVASVMEAIINAERLKDLKQSKKLRGGDIYYSIKIQEYRIGFVFENKVITLVRFLHRKDIYRYFPK